MAKVSEKDVNKFLDYIGIGKGSKRKETNLYKLLGIIPEVDDEGNRVPTPYEILQTPPQFRKGKEVPIVFAIKNRAKKIGKYTGSNRIFYYPHQKNRNNEPSINATLDELKKKYRHAIFIGNAEEALSYLELIEGLTGSAAEEIMGSYYNYALFYKRMKKQLLMDMFAHFFLTYFFRYRNNIREGLLKKSGHFRPYFEKNSLTLSGNELNEISGADIFANSAPVDFSGIKSIKFENLETDFDIGVLASQTNVQDEISKPEIPNIMSQASSSNLKTETANDSDKSKPENSETNDEKNEAKLEEEESKFDERKSYIKVPKSVKGLYDIPEFEKKATEKNIDLEERSEETKSFNWG